jgi:hypothetical protein
VYFHAADLGQWPAELPANEMRLRILGGVGYKFGASVDCFVEGGDPNAAPSVLAGAPGLAFKSPPIGAAHAMNVRRLLKDPNSLVFVESFGHPIVDRLFGGAAGSEAGRAVANLGEVSGDSFEDFAVAAPGERVVAVVYGQPLGAQTGSLDDVGVKIPGRVLVGALDRFGAAMAPLGLWGADSVGDFAVGAPGDSGDAGDVFLVNGFEGSIELPEDITTVAAVGFVGETVGDEAGAALVSADFDGDGRLDLLIGAPGHDDGRGRVYLIYHNPDLSGTISLSEVGASVPGVKFDGVAPGDRLGASLAAGGREHAKAPENILLGAPGVEAGRGAVYFVDGGQALAGLHSLTTLGTCDLRGWEFVGETPGQQVGVSVAGRGDLNRDELPDIAAGAPGVPGAVNGKVFLLFSSDTRLGEQDTIPVDPNSVGHGDAGGIHPFFP